MHLALIKYSVLRLAIFVGSLILLWAVGVRKSVLMLVLAALISLALSYLLLRKQRDELTTAIAQHTSSRLDRAQTHRDAATEAEDAADDAARSESHRSESHRSEG